MNPSCHFFLIAFIVFTFIFNSRVHPELMFVCFMSMGIKIQIFYHISIQWIQHMLLGKKILSSLHCNEMFVINQMTVYEWDIFLDYFLLFYLFTPEPYLSEQISHYIKYCTRSCYPALFNNFKMSLFFLIL